MTSTGDRSPNRTIVLHGEACVRARRALGLSRETLSASAVGPHPLSVATIKRAEAGQPVYLETARRLAELLSTSLPALLQPETEPIDTRDVDVSPPAISVLPFQWLGPAATGSYLALGLTEDLLARLSRWWFPVISPNAAVAPNVDAERGAVEISTPLRVRYWVEGSVQRNGDRVRVIARLVEGESGRILWTQTYDRVVVDVLRFQQELATRIIAEVGQNVLEAEALKAQRARSPQPSAWELSLLGAWHFQRQNQADNQRARALLSEALAQDPNLPLAWYTLAMTHRLDIINRWSESLPESLRALHDTGARFADAHPLDAGHHIVAAYVDVLVGARDTAKPRLDTAINIDPSHSTAYSVLGQTLAFRGEGNAAIEQFEVALRLRPVSIENWQPLIGMALAHFVEQRYEDTIAWSKQAIRLRPDMPIPLATLAVAASYLDDRETAAHAVTRLHMLDPQINVGTFQALGRSAEADIAARFFDGLRRAGLSD